MTTALLLMDLQNTILERYGPASGDFLDRVVAAQERAEQAGLLVVLVRVKFAPGRPEISPRNKMFAAARSMSVGADDRGSEPHDRLLRGKGEVVVTKKRVSAFAGSDLEVILRSHDVTELVLGGISTGGVVLSTVREAADRDYALTVLEDLCLDADEEVHRVLTQKVFPRQAEVIASADWRP
ncbi:cysteine hydrolase family protein [Petropleomorpha daqingensis]|uniref:Nicotinamidase-related amidase n=1 Tax=Petropleomorpha daqingensis TaxID=2026353 RepID=A0A853CJD9_9ACTN|nr:isochorismatase family cysteine hydrolase [Petropleomorpha daqingensis]NYJ06388.1 nicotinamidase-related amidase [Petropleomorpha daqingensis]